MARINHGLFVKRSATPDGHLRVERGFSLIELLVVVAIILIIAAIAVPNFLKARMSSNEAAAVHSLRTITTAQVNYTTMFPGIGYADTLTKLGGAPGGTIDSNGAHILDWLLGCAAQPCARSGYKFEIESTVGTPPGDYKATAVPLNLHVTGERGFCSSQANLLSVDMNGGTACTQPLK